MKKLKNILLWSMLSLASNAHANITVSRTVVDSISYVSLEDVKSLYTIANWSEDNKIFTITRNADNSEFKLNIETGDLEWKSQIIGNVPNAKKVNPITKLFPVNVIQTLTGTHAKVERDSVTFNYDPKLQSNNSWVLFVNDELMPGNIKSIGNVLLLPLDAVAKKLGSTVDFISGNIIYRRLQDGAKLELNTNTGLVKVNDKIQGTVGNLFYIDLIQKIVPLNIVEILAGITVDIDANASKINIALDSRIAKTSFGSKLIAQELKETPFTVQSLGYNINSDGMTTLKMDMYMSSYNGRINYQSGASIFNGNGARPSLLNFQWSSYEGSSGTLGDVNLSNRQLSGINVSRIKGVEYNNTTSDGEFNYSLTAGQIVQNYSEVYNQQFNDIKNQTNVYVPLMYGGGAYGIRIYPKNKPYEIGLSYLDDQQLGRNWKIGSFAYKSQANKKFEWNYYLNVDAGQLSNRLSPTVTKSGFDMKGAWSLNKNYEKFNLNFDGSYSGQLFEQYYQPSLQSLINNNNGIGNNPLSPLLPNIDNIGYSKLSQNGNISYRLNDSLSFSYGLNYNQRKNEFNYYSYKINNLGISKSFKSGSISINNLIGSGTDAGGKYDVKIVNAVAQKNFEYVNLMGRLDYDYVSKASAGQVSAQIAPYKTEWKNFNGSLNSSINYNFAKKGEQSNQSSFMNLNYSLSNSAPMKGWNFVGGVGASIKLYENNSNNNFISNFQDQKSISNSKKVNPFLFATANYALSKSFRFQTSLSYDPYGKVRVFAGISGDIDYAPARTVSNYIASRGLLRGKVFIDENYDGVQQASENKPISVLVSVKGTGLSLNTNQFGDFTIQNLNPGLYEVGVSLDNLPLGWALDEKANTRFSITGDQITEMSLPLRRVYGITGQVVPKKSENEGLTVELSDKEEILKKTLTTFGGQFSFDGLKPGEYTIKVYDSNELSYTQKVTLDASSSKRYVFEIN